MEGLDLLKDLLKEKDYMCKIELKYAYFCVPLHQKHWKYIRFCWEGQLYEYFFLYFGLGPAPRIFTELLKIPIAILRRINIRIIVYLDHMLLMSQTIEGLNMARDTLIFLLQQLGFHNKSEKISTVGNPETRILGPGNRLSQHGSNFANGKSKKFNSEMQKPDGKSQTNVVGNYKLDRFTLRNSTRSDASIFTNKISATAASGIYNKAIFLPLNSSSEPKSNSGTNMVGKQPRNIKWEVNFVTHKQNYNPNRWRSMHSSGVKVIHQSARTQSYKSGPINFSQDVLSESSPFSTGQHDDSIVFDENGRNWKQGDDSSLQGNLGICSISEDHNYCRVSVMEIECENRLSVQEFSGFQQMRVVPQGVSNNKSKLGYLGDRSICLQSLPSTSHPNGFETRSSQSGNRHFPTEMEKPGTSMCFPPFSLIGRVLLRVREEGLTMILVTPNWPAQPWYSQVLDLCITEPLLLPQSQEHFLDPKGQLHPLVLNKTLKLMTRKISVKTWLRKEFQTRLSILSQIPEDQALQLITNWPGKNGLAGVVNDRLTRSHAV